MPRNKDELVAGSVAAAKTVFINNMSEAAISPALSQYWLALAAAANAGGTHFYPNA